MLHEGRLVALGAPQGVITRERLQAVYGIAVSVVAVDMGAGPRRTVCVPSLLDDPTEPRSI